MTDRQNQPDSDNQNNDDRNAYYSLMKLQEWLRTARWLIAAGAAVYSIKLVTDAAVKLMDKPPWLQALALLSGPMVVFWTYVRMRRGFQRHAERLSDRATMLESSVDPGRTSSLPAKRTEEEHKS